MPALQMGAEVACIHRAVDLNVQHIEQSQLSEAHRPIFLGERRRWRFCDEEPGHSADNNGVSGVHAVHNVSLCPAVVGPAGGDKHRALCLLQYL